MNADVALQNYLIPNQAIPRILPQKDTHGHFISAPLDYAAANLHLWDTNIQQQQQPSNIQGLHSNINNNNNKKQRTAAAKTLAVLWHRRKELMNQLGNLKQTPNQLKAVRVLVKKSSVIEFS